VADAANGDGHTSAVSRSAGDRRAVALRPEPRGHLAATRCRTPSTRPAALVNPPETGGLRRSLRTVRTATYAVSRSAGDRRAVALRPEPRGHLAATHCPAPSTGPNAVSRSAGDRRAVALRPEPRGHLAATHCRAPSTRPAALVDPPETGGLRRSLRTVRTATHAVSRSAGDRRAVALRPEPRGAPGRPDLRVADAANRDSRGPWSSIPRQTTSGNR